MEEDRGSGLVGALGGLAMFLMLLLLAANVLLHLYASSTVTAVAFDTARRAAGAAATAGSAASRSAAVATARQLLPADATFDWSGTTDDAVRLTVDVAGPRLLPSRVLQGMAMDRVSRSVVVRTERFRDPS